MTTALPDDIPAAATQRAQSLAEGLYPHQIEGIAFLLGRPRAILADDMGLGKTRQSVLALNQTTTAGPYLVVCPAAVKRNWAREINLVLPQAPTHIVGPDPAPNADYTGWVIINYDILGKHIELLAERPWRGLVFDEAHYLKNHRSQRSRFARQIVDQTDDQTPIHLLTGTPLTSRPRDLFILLQLAKHALGRSFLTFAKRYCDAYKGEYGWVADGASNIEELTVQLHGIMLRRTKAQVLDLPPKLRTWLEVEVASKVAHRLSQSVMEILRHSSRRGTDPYARPDEDESQRNTRRGQQVGQLTTARWRLAASKVRSTIAFVENALEQGEKVIVFSCFIRPIQTLGRRFADQGVVITGSTPAAKRQELADRFQNDPEVRVLVANITAAGIGLNLTAARQVVFNDLDWVPANHWQAEDRAYRIGQTQAVNVTYMVGLGTVDEFVRAVLETKADLVDRLIEGQALPADFQRDIFGELRQIATVLGPQLDTLTDLDEAQMVEVLRQASQAYRQTHQETTKPQVAPVPTSAIAALARVLAGPRRQRYRVESSSKKGAHYDLELVGSDITCSCKGFTYRGSCQHTRTLKQVLVAEEELPAGFEMV